MATFETVNIDALFTMLKGEPGTRKSTCALSYPTPQYWISTDQKMQALMMPMKRWGINPKEVHFDNYTDWTKPRNQLEKLQVNCSYKTIIVDSITSIGDCMNRETIKQKRQAKSEGSEGAGGKKIGNIYVPGIEEYNAEASAFQELIAILKDIHEFHKTHIILIAHVVGQRAKDNAVNNLTHHSRVIITGGDKISGKIASYMTEVYHFNIESDFNADSGEGKFGLFTQHTGNDYARTSLPLERKIIFNNEPLYDKWIAPGIAKLKAEKPIQKIPTSTTPQTLTSTITQIK